MKKSGLSLLSLVVALGLAGRGVATAADDAPPTAVESGVAAAAQPTTAGATLSFAAPITASAASATSASTGPSITPLDAEVASQNTFIAPGASPNAFTATTDANTQLNSDVIAPEAPAVYGSGFSGEGYDPGARTGSRAIGPASGPQIDQQKAGRVINNSYSGDWFDYCGPSGKSCCSQIYGAADVWALDRKDATYRAIAINPAFTAITLSTADPNFRWDKATPRLTVGRVFCDWAIEGSALYKDDIAAHADNAANNTSNHVIFFGAQPLGSNYTGATHVRLDIYDGFHSYELNAIDTRSFFQMMYGIRYIEFREKLSVLSESPTGSSNGEIGTYNRMIGGQIGVRMNYVGTMFDWEFNLKGGIYHNDCNIGTFIRDNNNTTLIRNSHVDGQNEAYLAEMNLMASYRVSNSIKVRFGYQLMYLTEIALAGDQIQTSLTGTSNTGLAADAKGDMFMRGFVGGVEYRW